MARTVERGNHQRSAWTVTVISLEVIIIHSNRWVHSFHSKRPEAFLSVSPSLLILPIPTALINACSNYSLIEITVSYFIRNPLFDSFQMRVQILVSWCCLMRGRVRGVDRAHSGSRRIRLWRMTRDLRRIKWWITSVQLIFWRRQCGICLCAGFVFFYTHIFNVTYKIWKHWKRNHVFFLFFFTFKMTF